MLDNGTEGWLPLQYQAKSTPSPNKHLKWETLVIVSVTQEFPVTRYMELLASEVHPTHAFSWVGPGGRKWPNPSKLQENDSRRPTRDGSWEKGRKTVNTDNLVMSDAKALRKAPPASLLLSQMSMHTHHLVQETPAVLSSSHQQ